MAKVRLLVDTAWAKKLPLLTRKKRHFEHIKEIDLCPHYIYEDLVTNPPKKEDKK